ncbi:heme-dependent oxidative N-demethylase family protein [Shimia sp. FJ5]|uniref:heme-dependent oxidative N-demethylase family protein n=1 Tax=Shimia sp. FJ5 TaxID=3079054 RepID=UPI0026032B63|nr:DUF3445 domain-containing protein [Shimia sp. FJ5]MDV4145552.1 DUF3445 domain-containing protein [Shimia sp. FJ5]
MSEILQTTIPFDALSEARLPGISPLDPTDWIVIDEAYDGQMARREALLEGRRATVLAMDERARPAARELLETVLAALDARADFIAAGAQVICPDGRRVAIDWGDPLGTLGRLVQEDFCLLEKRGEEHVLIGAVLCFPASWTLAEKFLQPLVGIHASVPEYTEDIARRVQRLFDGVRPERPLWRFNALWYDDPELHQPRSAKEPRRVSPGESGPYFRCEKQSILRLPETGVAVFSIHTFVVARENMMADQNAPMASPAPSA